MDKAEILPASLNDALAQSFVNFFPGQTEKDPLGYHPLLEA